MSIVVVDGLVPVRWCGFCSVRYVHTEIVYRFRAGAEFAKQAARAVINVARMAEQALDHNELHAGIAYLK